MADLLPRNRVLPNTTSQRGDTILCVRLRHSGLFTLTRWDLKFATNIEQHDSDIEHILTSHLKRNHVFCSNMSQIIQAARETRKKNAASNRPWNNNCNSSKHEADSNEQNSGFKSKPTVTLDIPDKSTDEKILDTVLNKRSR
ncbi:hypothetical protein TNCV_4918941 [Trichonephila clavipes]|nr:hypothetical protein TNCV_4918941 [Trichonephila clavipes]